MEGEQLQFYKNGEIKSIKNCEDNKQNGISKYYIGGNLYRTELWEDDEIIFAENYKIGADERLELEKEADEIYADFL
jgi:antitoxin component YwqK of YwqJK toxin-antitoxin module